MVSPENSLKVIDNLKQCFINWDDKEIKQGGK